ncbi:MAG: hypothetical protein AABY05_03505 [Nanoarchaeota archaeon]
MRRKYSGLLALLGLSSSVFLGNKTYEHYKDSAKENRLDEAVMFYNETVMEERRLYNELSTIPEIDKLRLSIPEYSSNVKSEIGGKLKEYDRLAGLKERLDSNEDLKQEINRRKDEANASGLYALSTASLLILTLNFSLGALQKQKKT